MDSTQDRRNVTVIRFDLRSAIISFATWLALVAGATFSFCLLAGYPFPSAGIWVVLVPTAMLLATFSSVAYQLAHSRI